jgi:hypothetical protein
VLACLASSTPASARLAGHLDISFVAPLFSRPQVILFWALPPSIATLVRHVYDKIPMRGLASAFDPVRQLHPGCPTRRRQDLLPRCRLLRLWEHQAGGVATTSALP